MSDTIYSADAINVLNKFHRCEQLVYVEGEDDILFWDTLFQCCGIEKYKIEPKDGVEELNKYIDKLEEEELDIIIATDSDYHIFNKHSPKNKKIIRTIGYSIENTLFVPKCIERITKLWTKGEHFHAKEYKEYLKSLISNLEDILILDIANFLFELYQEALGDNCTQYMKTQACLNIDDSKIRRKLARVSPNFTEAQVSEAKLLYQDCTLSSYEYLRGHFLQSVVLKYISQSIERTGKKYKVSNISLYTNAIQELERSMTSKQHEHYEYYTSEINRVFNPS